jgi:nucleotide-binding universal stress UspA family protein
MERAVTLAQNNQASLTTVAIAPQVAARIQMPRSGPSAAELQGKIANDRAQRLEALVAPYRERVEIQTKVLVGVPFLEIIREVLRNGRDLVIRTPETPDWLDRLFGSDDMHLLRKCPCPVWLIKPEKRTSYRRILAAVDIGELDLPPEVESQRAVNRQILEMGSSLALSDFAELHIVHAWEAIGESLLRHGVLASEPEEQVRTYVEQMRQRHEAGLERLVGEVIGDLGKGAFDYLKPQTHLVKGWARKEIPALANRIGADLVVMGTVARTGIPGFLIGNTAETILNQIDCSVLAIKPPGFVTPVTLED